MKSAITLPTLKRFLKLALTKLRGDWVLLGGNVLPLLGSDIRPTTDIDFVPMGDAPSSDQLRVMEICEELGLPPEAANPAAALFLKRVAGYQKNLTLVDSTPKTRIFRPNAALFLKLKSARLSESDLLDCLEMLRIEGDTLKVTDRKNLVKTLKELLKTAESDKQKRIEELLLQLE